MSDPSASTLANEADQRLFRSVIHNSNHVLNKLLPDVRRVSYNLRPRVHEFELFLKDDRNFISRLLFNYINSTCLTWQHAFFKSSYMYELLTISILLSSQLRLLSALIIIIKRLSVACRNCWMPGANDPDSKKLMK